VSAISQRWRTFRALSRADRDIAWAAAFGLTATWLGLRTLGFRRWHEFVLRRVGRPKTIATATYSSAISANRISQLEAAAARNLFFSTNCLEQSLVLWSILRREGFAANLKIGARKEAGRFEAHAWVELNGLPLNDETEGHRTFVPFDGAIGSMETQPE
jgi:Transglutaminase-like superfamily